MRVSEIKKARSFSRLDMTVSEAEGNVTGTEESH